MRGVHIGQVLCLALALCCGHASAQSLRDLFVSGLTADPALAASEAQFRASEERVRQARSAVMPAVALQGSSSTGRFYPDDDTPDRDFHADRWSVQLTQPLYRPESYSGLDAAHAELEAARVQLEAAAADLATRLATAYFEMLSAREDQLSLDREFEAAQLQRVAARRSFETGTVTITDLLDAEAKHDVTAAQKDVAESALILKREAFRQLIGGHEFELGVLPRATPDPLPVEEELTLLVEEALERNPTAQQARLQWEASRHGVRRARRAHLPTVDLVYSYGSDKSSGTPSNPVPVRGHSSQAQASLNLPIFSGFGTDAKVGEALALQDKLQADLETAERGVAMNVREAYYGVKSSLSQVASLQAAEKSTETAVRAQRKGYRIGTTTTTEVLKAETLYSQARRDLMKAKLDARLNRIKLQIALGRPWRESVDELSGLLVSEHAAPAGNENSARPSP